MPDLEDQPEDEREPDIDREIRINEMRHQLEEMGGSLGTSDLPPDLEEQFLAQVLAYETAPISSPFDRLIAAGVDLPAPDELSDAEITAKLKEVVLELARMRSYLHSTEHLSDRELYENLWHDSLREESPEMPTFMGGTWHIDLTGSGSDEDMQVYLKYYADEETRDRWKKDFPDTVIPGHVDPPYQRDWMPEEELPPMMSWEDDEDFQTE